MASKKKTIATVEVVQMDEEKLKSIISVAVSEALIRIGLNVSDPVELQKDMAYLRSWRQLVQTSGKRAWFTTMGIMLIVVIAAFAVGIGIPAKILGIAGLAAKTQ